MSDPTKYEPKVEVVPSGHVLLTAQKQQEDFENWLGGVVKPCVHFRRLSHGKGLPLPAYANPGDAGMDLPSARNTFIEPGERLVIGVGFAVEIPHGFEGQVRPRSGLAARHGITVLNAPGTIDNSFRGEIGVILINHGSERFEINRGDRIAQLVIAPVSRLKIEEVEQLSETERGASGFGSTGS